MKRKSSFEFENFNRMTRELLKIPHSEIKKRLEAEKAAKLKKKKGKSDDN